MINVNWTKIKPFEKKAFAIPVMAVLILVCIVSVLIGFKTKLPLAPLKYLTGLFFFLIMAFGMHIESRMLQIYALLGVLDITFLLAGLLNVPTGLTIFFFVVTLVSLFLTIGITLFISVAMLQDTAYENPEPDRGNIYAGREVMLFAPHEDDEINIYGGLIEQYVKHGSNVRIVFSTNGDFHRLGKIRITEALNVADQYGIPRENIIFLGYSDSLKNDRGLHIYNCKDDELVESSNGFRKTYGNMIKEPYNESVFKREAIIEDIESVIEEFKPDTIMCCDYDIHSDHRAISLFFEEALQNILIKHSKDFNPYRPEVYKGFAYSTAWNGKKDYYSPNAKATNLIIPTETMDETGIYKWDDRVRFPVAAESLSRVMQNNSSYIAMMKYSSQTATDHANGILNSDRVLWKRRTDSVLLGSDIKSTSGDASHIADFKLVDSLDIANDNSRPNANRLVFDIVDEKKMVAFKLEKQKEISSVVIYGNPGEEYSITNAIVYVGSKQFETGKLNADGAPTVFEFPAVSADLVAVKIKSYIGEPSILKVEAFEKIEDKSLKFIKVINQNNDFCYDYIINKSGHERLYMYTYPETKNIEYTVKVEGDVNARIDGDELVVNCLEGESGVVTVSCYDNPDIYDSIVIRNLDERERYIVDLKQKYEQQIYSYSMQWDYYSGLIKRLGTYIF